MNNIAEGSEGILTETTSEFSHIILSLPSATFHCGRLCRLSGSVVKRYKVGLQERNPSLDCQQRFADD